jgi:hypothetical protein
MYDVWKVKSIDQLPTRFLLAGDFIARSPVWAKEKTCRKGLKIEKCITNFAM